MSAAPAVADPVPFSDPAATGRLGFCDKSGHEVRSGDIGAAPFAWTAVSSVPAPSGYGAPRGRAALFVYQPIQYVDPGDWSGKQLTASSTFTNSAHPMAQATVLDPAMVDFTSAFPPHWDGLVQLRMYFAAPDQPQATGAYPAAVVRVSDHKWTLVSGGDVPCNAGTARSAETINLPPSAFKKATPRSTPSAGPGTASKRGPEPGHGTASSAGGASVGHASGRSAPAELTAARKRNESSGYALFWIVLAVAGTGSVGLLLIRRRRASG